MTADRIIAALLAANVAGGAAILVVLALRGIIRRLAGAKLAYISWLIVPIAIAAGFIPARVEILPVSSSIVHVEPGIRTRAELTAVASFEFPRVAPAQNPGATTATQHAADAEWRVVLIIAWAAGALIALAVLIARQFLAVRDLGPLTRLSDTTSRAARDTIGPAVIGIFSPRIVLPANFEASFDDTEQKVVLAHEEAHLQGRHTAVKTLVEIAVCLAWFNPLAYIAARAIAMDQELACDEAVAMRYPGDRRVYAGALLKAHGGPRLPLGCYWPAGSARNLKARIKLLGLAVPKPSQRVCGAGALALLVVAAGGVAWAAKPVQTRNVETPPDISEPHAPPEASALQARTGLRANATVYLRGKVERIDFGETSYVAYLRARSIAADEAAPALANSALWELAPTPYWGDRTAVTRDLMNAHVAARGVNATGGCASSCRLTESSIIVPKSSALPAASLGFGMADFAMRYDTSKSYLIRGTVERIEFGERTFDAYVRTEPRGPIPGSLFQVRSENRFTRAEVEAQLLKRVVTIAGWRTRGAATGADREMWPNGPMEAACDAVCGLYGTDFELPGKLRLTPAGAELLSQPARYDPDTIPLVPSGYAAVAEIADRNAPLTLTGRITRLEDGSPNAAFFVEATRVSPASVLGAEPGTLWRVVALEYRPEPNWIGATVTLRGFAAKDKSCRPTCLMSVTNLQVFGRS